MTDASWHITERLKITLQNILVHHSWLLEWPPPPPPSGMLDPCQSSSNTWKLISSIITWLHLKLKKKKTSSFYLSLSPSLASLYLLEQCLRLGVTSTSSVWSPLQDESFYVFRNCKSLLIKTSTKWLNVNINVKKALTSFISTAISEETK